MTACLGLVALGACSQTGEATPEKPSGAAEATAGTSRSHTAGTEGLSAEGPGGEAKVIGQGGRGGAPAKRLPAPLASSAAGLGEVVVVEKPLLQGDPITGVNLGSALCDTNKTVVSGGCNCNGQPLVGTRMEDKGWSCACVTGDEQKAYAVCVDGDVTVTSVAAAFPGRSDQGATTQCAAGSHLISVGVHCGFTGPKGPRGPTGHHGYSKTVMPTDASHALGHCGTSRVGGGIEATLYAYCVPDSVGDIGVVSTPSSNSSQCGDGTVVVGGGCQCHDVDRGPLLAAYIEKNGFACSCTHDTANETIALCAKQ
jgi:hypothetical protein